MAKNKTKTKTKKKKNKNKSSGVKHFGAKPWTNPKTGKKGVAY